MSHSMKWHTSTLPIYRALSRDHNKNSQVQHRYTVTSFIRLTRTTILNYSKTTRNILFIDVSASRRKPSSGLTSGAGRQYVKACPIHGSVPTEPHMGQAFTY